MKEYDITSDISEDIRYSVKAKPRRTLDYLYKLAKASKDGYFHLVKEQCVRDLGISERTVYNHLKELNEKNIVCIAYKGSQKLDELALDLLKDTGRTIKGIGGLYYFYKSNSDSPLEKDIAILRHCFGWQEGHIKHYQRWSDAENLTYDTDRVGGFSKITEEHLSQFFRYMVKGEFDWNNEEYDCYMDEFERLIA